jgi:hypothetical protein
MRFVVLALAEMNLSAKAEATSFFYKLYFSLYFNQRVAIYYLK